MTSKSKINLIVVVILLTTFFLIPIIFPYPTTFQYYFFTIAMAVLLGYLLSFLPGLAIEKLKPNIIEIRGRRFKIQVSGFLLFTILSFIFSPATLILNYGYDQPFDYTFFLEDSTGISVLKNEAKLILHIGNDKKTKLIDLDGSATFKQIPFKFTNEIVSLQIEVKGWQFTNGKKITEIKLDGNNQKLIVERDNSLCCVGGSVQDEENNFLTEVKISIGDVFTITDESGRFSIEIPRDKQKQTQTLIAVKKGFKTWEGNVSPSLMQEVKIILFKK